MKIEKSPKFSFGFSSMSTLKGMFFLFIILSIFTIGSALVNGNLLSLNTINKVYAQVTGRPAPNSGTIADTLKGQDNEEGVVQVTDSYDRCRIIDPNLAEPTRVADSGALTNLSLADNLGGINLAPVLDFSDYASTSEYKSSFSKGSELGMSYILGMVTDKNAVGNVVGFINEANQNGFVPVVRLCYPGGCNFDLSNDAQDIINFYRSVSSQSNGDFVAMLGPNEPGSGEPQLEMEAFNIKKGDYGTLVDRAEEAANALQPLRAANGGNMYLAPAAFNVTNAINDDALQYFKNGLNTSLFDVVILNSYNLAGGTAYDFYKSTAQGFPLKDTVEQAGLKAVVTEFGTFTETTNFDSLKDSFDKFCSDETVEGVLFFRSFQSLSSIEPEPHPNLIPDSVIRDIVSNCSKGSLRDWAWANCNFDSCIYEEDYDSKSTASSCGITSTATRQDTAGAALRLKCVETGCGIDWQQTLQVSLPIKQFGSNLISGTQNFNYPAICAELANFYDTGAYDALNQFAGSLKGDNGLTYPMPWLGSAINCSSELIKLTNQNALDYSSLYSPSVGSSFSQTKEEVEKESTEQDYKDLGFTNAGSSTINSGDRNQIIDERTVCLDDNCLDKSKSLSAPIYSPYIPAQLAQSYYRPASCSSSDLLIRNEPNNYIIGPEVYISDRKAETFFIGSHDICYQYLIRNSGSSAVDERMAFGPNTKLSCGIVDPGTIPAKGLAELNGFNCNAFTNLLNAEVGGEKTYHKGVANIAPNLRWCFKYNAKPEDEVFYYKSDFATPPKFEIPGIYDSLYETYKRTQTIMSERYLKVVVRENIGWEAKVTVKMRDLNSPYEQEPYMYSQELNSCNVPDNLFDNRYKLGRGNPEQTTSQYFDWLGYLDIMQEWNMTYSRDYLNTAEKIIQNPLKDPEFADIQIPDELNKDYILLSGTASQATRFPILTCDEIALNKVGIGFKDSVAYRLPEDKIYAADFNPTCIDQYESDRYDDELQKFLCEQGYEDMCVTLPPELVCRNEDGQVVNQDDIDSDVISANATCPVANGLCIRGPGVLSHGTLNAIDISTPQKDADGNYILVAPFDGKIVGRRTNTYCANTSLNGGDGLYFQGKVAGQTVTLFMYHLRSKFLVSEGVNVKAGTPIAQLAEPSDADIDSLACLPGVPGTAHVHIEFADNNSLAHLKEGNTPFDLRAFTYQALGCKETTNAACSTDIDLGIDNVNNLVCEYENTEIPVGNGPNVCNEFNCAPGDPARATFETSLLCAAQTLSNDVSAGKSLAELLDEYGPYCDNETLGVLDNGSSKLPFAFNFITKLYDPFAIAQRSCSTTPPSSPRQEDVGLRCTDFGRTLGNLRADQDAWDYYRAPLETCGLSSDQMTWEGGTNGLGIDEVTDKMINEVNYAGFRLSNVPRQKVEIVVKTAKDYNINPYILVALWGTESWFGQFNPVCNVY
ncbi:hypothetical protein KC678_00960 [Candidatus Dojkabacteria bacterium]|uniref:Uncharacterized protein n=1 Tax=Candidatus Dojkabacteria bacterium TaxID=2099670 RepID=A0A955I8F7_9BACT|nr:hypothetical protein [Candidatus Dojkabacteria bacterium]